MSDIAKDPEVLETIKAIMKASQKESPEENDRPPSRGSNASSHSAGEISSGSFDGFRSIRVRSLPLRSTDSSIRDGLKFEYKKCGKVLGVAVRGEAEDRFAIVTFSQQEEAEEALRLFQDKLFFGSQIIVSPSEEEAQMEPIREPIREPAPPPREYSWRPPEPQMDDIGHVKAPRTLFVGNIDREIGPEILKDIFKEFGEIKGLDYKIQRMGTGPAYAFIHYVESDSVHEAMREMDGTRVGNFRIKCGYGKAQITHCVWLEGLASSVTEKHLHEMFSFYGTVTKCVVNVIRKQALVFFDKTESAQLAVHKMTGRTVAGKKIQIDFASKEIQATFTSSRGRGDYNSSGGDGYYDRGSPPGGYSPEYYGKPMSYRRPRSASIDDAADGSPPGSPYRRPLSPGDSPPYRMPVKRRPVSPDRPPSPVVKRPLRSLSRSRSPESSRRMSSPESPRRAGSPPNKSSGDAHHGICVHNLPLRSTDTAIRDGLNFGYKKNGKISNVKVFGKGEDRFAVVTFRKSEDAAKALATSKEKVFFGSKVIVTTHEGFLEPGDLQDSEDDLDEYHPKATKTLFVGNLEKEIDNDVLRDIFQEYGEILDVEMKRHLGGTSFAFIQYTDITSVVRALKKMDGASIGNSKLKLGFGKSVPTVAIWVGWLANVTIRKVLFSVFGQFGHITHLLHDRKRLEALIFYENVEHAQNAVNDMKGRVIQGSKVHIDFASPQCQMAFQDAMEQTGQLKNPEHKIPPAQPQFKPAPFQEGAPPPFAPNKFEYAHKRGGGGGGGGGGGFMPYPSPRGMGPRGGGRGMRGTIPRGMPMRGMPLRGRGRVTDYSNYRSGVHYEQEEYEEDYPDYEAGPSSSYYPPPERPARGGYTRPPYTRGATTSRYEEYKPRRKAPLPDDSYERELQDYHTAQELLRRPKKIVRRVSVSPEPGPYRRPPPTYREESPDSGGYESPDPYPRYQRISSRERMSERERSVSSQERYAESKFKFKYKVEPSEGRVYKDSATASTSRSRAPERSLPKAYAMVEEREHVPKGYGTKRVPKAYRLSPDEGLPPAKVYKKRYLSPSPPPSRAGPSSSMMSSKSRQSDYPGFRIKRKSYPPEGGVEEKRPRRPPSPVYSDASGYSKTPTPPPPSNMDDDDF